MNILVIGNGFDLAHGLPTKYWDFLEFCNRASKIYTFKAGIEVGEYERIALSDWRINNEIKESLKIAFASRKLDRKYNDNRTYSDKYTTDNKVLDEFYCYVKDNAWLGYFTKRASCIGENWIDFELEISQVVKALDEALELMRAEKDIINLSGSKTNTIIRIVKEIKIENGKTLLPQEVLGKLEGILKVISILEKDLIMLNRALEIYFCEFVEKIECNKISPDICGIMTYSFEYADKSSKNKISKVLSFNYTSTYEQIYFNNLDNLVENVDKTDVDYLDHIHGKADINHTIESNDMVLGIDEYLSDDRKDSDIGFIAFKKFYQRIYKGTGCKYKEWVNEIRQSYQGSKQAEEVCTEMVKNALKKGDMNKALKWMESSGKNYEEGIKKHELYIFGHSLDVTDKDILRDLILNDNLYTTIYYHKTYDDNGKDDNGRIDLGSKIANLVKVIGQDELIRRTGGSTRTIKFKLQQDMVERT